MAIRTIAPVAVTAGANVVAFQEGVLDTTTYVVEGTLVDSGGYVLPFNPNTDVSSKTNSGFTVTCSVAGTFSAIVVEYGTATPDGSQNIVSVSVIKEYLNIAGSDYDTFLSRWLTYVSDAIEGYTGMIFKQRNFTLYEIGDGSDVLYPSKFPIVSLQNSAASDVQYRTSPSGSWTTLESTVANIIIDSNRPYFVKLYNTYFPVADFPNIKLNLSCGFSTVPQEVAMICIEAVAEKFKESDLGGSRLGISTKSLGEAGGNLSDSYFALSTRHMQILDKVKERITSRAFHSNIVSMTR